MKIIPEVIVQNPDNLLDYEKHFVDELLSLLVSRINASNSAKHLEVNLYVYIKIGREHDFAKMVALKDKLYFSKDLSMDILSDTRNIADILRNAILKNAIVPDSMEACMIYLSLIKTNSNDVFAAYNKKNDEKLNFTAIEPMFEFEQVVMNESERKAIMLAVALIKEKNLIYEKWNFKNVDKFTKSILCFHGVPGTGKTMAAHAVAQFLGKKILVGSYAQIESEFVGVGAKNLKAFFEAAEKQDAVLFIDEADTFLSKRLPSSNDSAKHYNSMSNELYQLIESFNGCIIFASNHIKDFDPAVISRIIEPVEFKLPDTEARSKILNILIQEKFPIEGGKTDDLLSCLANLTEGFSGRDLRKALLLSNANAAYNYKMVENAGDDEIVISVDLIKECFASVKESKEILDKATEASKGGANILSDYTEKKRRDTRFMEMAAHALLADGIVDITERKLYNELSSVMRVKVPLEQDALHSIETICGEASSKEERLQLLDIVTRMSACDCKIPTTELELIKRVALLLGLPIHKNEMIEDYTNKLAETYFIYNQISDSLGRTDKDIISEMMKEFTEGAAYYHLAKMYKNGNDAFGGIIQNDEKASLYYDKAKELGFSRDIDCSKNRFYPY